MAQQRESLRVTIAMMKHHGQNQHAEERVYLALTTHHLRRKSGQELKQDRSLEAGANAETTEECLLPMTYSVHFLIEPRTTSPEMTIDWAVSH